MNVLDVISKDALKVHHTFMFRLENGLARVYDIDEALVDPHYAFNFVMRFIGRLSKSEITKLEDVFCKNPSCAYYWAARFEEADIAKCQEAVLSGEMWSKLFVKMLASKRR